MRSSLLTIGAIFAIAFGWQHKTLRGLRAAEFELMNSRPSASTLAPADDSQAGNSPAIEQPVSDAEMEQLMVEIENLKMLRPNPNQSRFLKPFDALDAITPTLKRLSAEQLHFAVKQWSGGEVYEVFFNNETVDASQTDFLEVTAEINPEAVIQMFFKAPELSEDAAKYLRPSFRSLFAQDADAAHQLAASTDVPEQFRELCDLWKDAVATFKEPTAENMKRLISHEDKGWDRATVELVKKLPTQEARIAFFRQLSATTDGTFSPIEVDDLGTMVRQQLRGDCGLGAETPARRDSQSCIRRNQVVRPQQRAS